MLKLQVNDNKVKRKLTSLRTVDRVLRDKLGGKKDFCVKCGTSPDVLTMLTGDRSRSASVISKSVFEAPSGIELTG